MATPLREARERSGLSQARAARRVGVTAAFLSQLETGKRSPSLEVAQRLAALFNTTVEDLFRKPAAGARR